MSEDGSGVGELVQLVEVLHQPLTHPLELVELGPVGGRGTPAGATSWKLTAAQLSRDVVYSMMSEPSTNLQNESLPLDR